MSAAALAHQERPSGAGAAIAPGAVVLRWLGQAGFLVRAGGVSLMIDPYLSDHLARKYAGTLFPHQRLMPAPFTPEEAPVVDAVLCTHGHSDHMDPGTLPVIARRQPSCRFVIPAAERDHALSLGLPEAALLPVDDGQILELAPGVRIEAIASAHETLKVNARGQHHFLGYRIELGALSLYHSGDAVPYAGLVERLRALRIDAALLPVNGRDEYRLSHGVLGNFTFDEAVELCRQAHIPLMIGHHWGMFEFNTVDPDALRRQIAALPGGVEVLLPALERELVFAPGATE